MRVKTGYVRRRKHHKVLERTKGFRMTKGRLYKVSKDADIHAGAYSYVGRKDRKGDFRKLWIIRLNAALAPFQIKYSHFINLLHQNKIELDRKVLAELAIFDPEGFAKIISQIKKAS